MQVGWLRVAFETEIVGLSEGGSTRGRKSGDGNDLKVWLQKYVNAQNRNDASARSGQIWQYMLFLCTLGYSPIGTVT